MPRLEGSSSSSSHGWLFARLSAAGGRDIDVSWAVIPPTWNNWPFSNIAIAAGAVLLLGGLVGRLVAPEGSQVNTVPAATRTAQADRTHTLVGAEYTGKDQGGPVGDIRSTGTPEGPSLGADIVVNAQPGQSATGVRVHQSGPGTGLRVVQSGPGTGMRVTVGTDKP